MATILTAPRRFARAVSALMLLSAAIVGPLVLVYRAPAAFALGAFFGTPLLMAALCYGGRWAWLAVAGRARSPTPPVRSGRLEAPSEPLYKRARPRN